MCSTSRGHHIRWLWHHPGTVEQSSKFPSWESGPLVGTMTSIPVPIWPSLSAPVSSIYTMAWPFFGNFHTRSQGPKNEMCWRCWKCEKDSPHINNILIINIYIYTVCIYMYTCVCVLDDKERKSTVIIQKPIIVFFFCWRSLPCKGRPDSMRSCRCWNFAIPRWWPDLGVSKEWAGGFSGYNPLVNLQKTSKNYGKSPFLMCKSTINCHVQ